MLNISSQKPNIEETIMKKLPQLNKKSGEVLNPPNLVKSKKNDLFENNKKNKKVVILLARQHPGETVGSHVIKGCIDFLMSETDEAKKLREIYDFKIFPMVNPDGVLVGNSRTSFSGCDLNRRWIKPSDILHPEILNIKSLILKTSTKRNISFIIDFHGHFTAINSLFYCNFKNEKKLCSLYPYLCGKLSNIISFEQSSFSMPKYKNSTERLTLFRELNDNDNNCIVALETSFFGIKNNNNTYYFNTKLLNQIGRDVCLGMLAYYFQVENLSIEKEFSNKFEYLNIDMKDFDKKIEEIKEDEEKENLTDSESEPSIDNLDKKEIIKLMPTHSKKKSKKIKNFNNYNFYSGHVSNNRIKKLDGCLLKQKNNLECTFSEKNKPLIMDIDLYDQLKRAQKLMKSKVSTSSKASITTSVSVEVNKYKTKKLNHKMSNSQSKQNINNFSSNKHQTDTIDESNEFIKIDRYTQTEEIFFKMSWKFFIGKFKILTEKRVLISKFPNISTIPIKYSGRIINYQNNSNFLSERRKELYIKSRLRNVNLSKFGGLFLGDKYLFKYKNIIEKNARKYKEELDNYSNKRLNIKPLSLIKINMNKFFCQKKLNLNASNAKEKNILFNDETNEVNNSDLRTKEESNKDNNAQQKNNKCL